MTSPTDPSRHQAVPQLRRLSAGPVASGAVLAVASAGALAVAALLSAGLAPVLAAEPSSPAPDAATSASILIVSLDTRGTDLTDDDVLLDRTVFSVHADDGDGAFDASLDAVAYGPIPAVGGLLDTSKLGPGQYWVDADPPAGYEAPPPILVELNTDATRTCVWDARGLTECQANDAGAEGLSWTMVLVRNAPAATPTPTPTPGPTAAPSDPTPGPTGEVQEATGRPAVTLPPTDRAGPGREPAAVPAAAWVIVLLLSFSAQIARAAWSTCAAAGRRPGPRLD